MKMYQHVEMEIMYLRSDDVIVTSDVCDRDFEGEEG